MDVDDIAPNGFLTCRGLRFPKDPQVLQGRARRLIRTGEYEAKEAEAALRMVQPGDRVLELGAGIGFMSALVSVKCGAARVDAFEANPQLLPYIARVHAANGVDTVTVHNALLAAEDGPPVPFYLRKNFLASSMDRDSDPDTVVDRALVPRRAIMPVLQSLRPDVLICDIEGAEAHLLPAADLSCLRVAILELHPQWIGQAGVQAVFDTFHRAGLTYWPKASLGKVVCFRKGW